MTIRVDISRLPEEVAEALQRGETVEFEHDGAVVGHVEKAPRFVNWKEFFEQRAKDPPLDYDDFIADLEVIRRELNQPAEDRWPS
jgi:hypothetical protein